ncbi:hypothetical protein PV326_009123 [Microctonus aethiopoides]|nr:hypothetical protein PV326_009123 [Microctonus aethiopoides]
MSLIEPTLMAYRKAKGEHGGSTDGQIDRSIADQQTAASLSGMNAVGITSGISMSAQAADLCCPHAHIYTWHVKVGTHGTLLTERGTGGPGSRVLSKSTLEL